MPLSISSRVIAIASLTPNILTYITYTFIAGLILGMLYYMSAPDAPHVYQN